MPTSGPVPVLRRSRRFFVKGLRGSEVFGFRTLSLNLGLRVQGSNYVGLPHERVSEHRGPGCMPKR